MRNSRSQGTAQDGDYAFDEHQYVRDCAEMICAFYDRGIKKNLILRFRNTVLISAVRVLTNLNLSLTHLDTLMTTGSRGVREAIDTYPTLMGDPNVLVKNRIDHHIEQQGIALCNEAYREQRMEALINPNHTPTFTRSYFGDIFDPEEMTIARTIKGLNDVILTLDIQHRRAIEQFYYRGKTTAEVSLSMNVAEGAVATLVAEALGELAKKLVFMNKPFESPSAASLEGLYHGSIGAVA